MKLTICQIAKLFLLLTAFFFLNSPRAAFLAFGSSPTPSSPSSSSFRPEAAGVLVLSAAKTATDFATTPSTKSVAATRTSPATAAAATLSGNSNSIWPTATQTQSPRNAREAARQKRQRQQQQQQQQLGQQRQRRQQQERHLSQRMAVLIPSSLHVDMTHVQQGFQNFLDFFQLHLSDVSVDFLRDVGEYTQAEKQTHQRQAKQPCLPCLLPQPWKSLPTCI